MRIIERNARGTEFAVWINKEEKNLLEAYEKMTKAFTNEEDRLLLINPDAYFGYNIKTGKAVILEFKELS